jgi:hypothetical protein
VSKQVSVQAGLGGGHGEGIVAVYSYSPSN